MESKLTESEMKPYAWKFEEENDGVVYNIQFNEVPWKMRKALLEAMKDWNHWSIGWHKSSGNQMFSFKKLFKNQQEWEDWANKFPMQIFETRVWGSKEKVVIHGKKSA